MRARFVVPAAYVRPAPGALSDTPGEVISEVSVADLPKDVLIVEDNMIIALDAESSIVRAGIETVRVAASVAQAMKAIATRPPDFALLDINLGRETSFAVAEHLDSLGIPFVFTTGYGEDIAFPPKLLGVPRIRKPYTGDALLTAMRR